ncbi:MAG TPA: ATP-binding protein, partial [Anaeromyxobacteraceae bacterium]|nr:ATP-binding protein [Anaeromyxobacteraceae bacterium]
ARADPAGLVAGLRGPVVIDEIQKAPDLLPAIKASIDRDRRPGRFLLTGSANVLTLPRVAESLAGRMEVATLWPLSQGELAGRRETFVDRVVRGAPPPGAAGDEDLLPRLARGGYPEAAARGRPERRRAFFDAYLAALVARDVRDIAAIEDPGALRRLLRLAAVRSASLLNHSELARTLAVPVTTLKRYLALVEALFLVHEVPAWASNRGKRLVRAAKLHVSDSGLLLAMAGLDVDALRRDRTLLGPVVESFVASELARQIGWSTALPALHHFRTHAGQEVDLVLEDARGRIVGIEVKASATVTASDLNGLRALATLAGKAWVQGLVLHLGSGTVAFGPGLTACPVEALWA